MANEGSKQVCKDLSVGEVARRSGIAVIRVAQRMGLPLVAIREALETLTEGRTPTKADWKRLSAAWEHRLTDRIEELTKLRDNLSECIGCGCLSLKTCPLRNPMDELSAQGPGPRLLESG